MKGTFKTKFTLLQRHNFGKRSKKSQPVCGFCCKLHHKMQSLERYFALLALASVFLYFLRYKK
jgi:hypothetical protein